MKKVLFATTALIATAGFAAAQGVEISGAAEMGYAGGSAGVTDTFFQTVDVFFDMSGETDNGLTFGASVDLDDAGGGTTDGVRGGSPDFTVFVSGSFGNLTMGDTDTAFDWALTEGVGNPGSIGDEETGHEGYIGGNYLDEAVNGQVLRYDNSFGDFSFAASVEMDEANDQFGWAIGGDYTFSFAGGSVNVGLGYIDADDNGDVTAISTALELDSGFEAGFVYADGDVRTATNTDNNHYQITAGYAFGPFSVGANYGEFENGLAGYGLAGGYDLGGGAELLFGYGHTDNTGATADVDSYSFGLSMSF